MSREAVSERTRFILWYNIRPVHTLWGNQRSEHVSLFDHQLIETSFWLFNWADHIQQGRLPKSRWQQQRYLSRSAMPTHYHHHLSLSLNKFSFVHFHCNTPFLVLGLFLGYNYASLITYLCGYCIFTFFTRVLYSHTWYWEDIPQLSDAKNRQWKGEKYRSIANKLGCIIYNDKF